MNPTQPRNAYSNSEEKQTAGILSKLLLASLVVYSFLLIAALFARDWEMVVVTVIGIILQAIPFLLIKNNKVFAASLILMALTFSMVTEFATIGQGIHDIALVAFPIIFIFAGLTFNRKILRVCIAMSIIAVGWLAFGERYGWFVPYPLSSQPGWSELAIASLLLLVAGMAVSLLTTNMKKNLEQLKTAQEALKDRLSISQSDLKESLLRYNTLIDSSHSIILEWDTQGNILFMNKWGLDFFGFSMKELIGCNVLGTIVRPVDTRGTNLAEKMYVVQKTPDEFYSTENENIKKNGEMVWIAWTNKGILDDNGILVKTLSVGIDRTTQRQQEVALAHYSSELEKQVLERTRELQETIKALRISDERFNLSMEASSEGLWDWDIVSDKSYFSPGYYKMLGYEDKAFAYNAQDWIERIHPDDRQKTLQDNSDCIEGRVEHFETEFRMRAKNGEWRWVVGRGQSVSRDVHGRSLRMVGTHIDISERKRAEDRLRQRNIELALLNQIGQRLNQLNNPPEILDCIYKEIAKLTDTGNLYIAQYDDKSQFISFDLYYIEGVRQSFAGRTLADGMTDYIIRTKLPLLVKQDFETFRQEHGIALVGKPSLSFLGVPIIAEDKVIGVIATQDYNRENAYDENDLELWTTIAAQASGALKNAQLLSALNKELEEHRLIERTLAESQTTIRSIFDSTSDMIWSVDPVNFGLLTFNQGLSEHYRKQYSIVLQPGYRPEELFKTQEFVDKWKVFYRCVLDKGTYHTEYTGASGAVILDLTFNLLKRDGAVFGISVFGKNITASKLADEKLRESEEQYRTLIESATEGIVIATRDGLLKYANKFALNMLPGYSEQEILSRPFMDFVYPEDRPLLADNFSKNLKGERLSERTQYRLKRRDGTLIWIEIGVALIDWKGEPATLNFLTDITYQKKTEIALKENEYKFRSAFMTGLDAFYLATLEEGLLLEVNDNFEKVWGYTKEEVIGKTSLELGLYYDPADRARLVSQLKTQGSVRDLELKGRKKGGELITISISVSILVINGKSHILGIIRDITDRKKLDDVQKFLIQTGSQSSGVNVFESLAKYLSEILEMEYVCIDRLEGDGLTAQTVAVYNNGAYEPNVSYALKDTPCGDVVGKTICCFQTGVRRLFPLDTALQELRAESYLGTTLRDYDGKPIGLVAVIGQKPLKDTRLSEQILQIVAVRASGEMLRLKGEQENKRLRDKAEMSSRLAAIGEMAAGIAHEINNPLTGVIGFSELLMEKKDVPDDIKDELKIINDGSQRVKEIVKRMLTFARQAKPVKTSTSINELIDATLGLRAYVLRTANIEVVKYFGTNLPWVVVDPGQMQQVFLNIIVNAEYAMKKAHGKGTLTITTERIGDHIHILFKDDGMGMDKETKEKLFNPFFTTKQVGEGTGLGLSLSHSIVLEHGGTVTVESEPGQGATFIITLPVTPAPEEAASIKADAAPVHPRVKAARILVVDDEESIRKLVSTLLSSSGHTVETTSDAREALLKMDSVSYDAVLVDIRMPQMSGMELYDNIKPRRPELAGRFLFITGDTSDSNTRDFLEKNGLSFITKPFDKETLFEKLNRLL